MKEYLDESKEIDKRKMNLIVNGIAESRSTESRERIEDDRNEVKNIFRSLGVEPDDLSDLTVRLGKVSERFPNRSLLISVKSLKTKGDLMKAQVGFRQRNPTKRLYISPDLSPRQREDNKVLVAEFKGRKGAGENVKIRSGKIVTIGESLRLKEEIVGELAQTLATTDSQSQNNPVHTTSLYILIIIHIT